MTIRRKIALAVCGRLHQLCTDLRGRVQRSCGAIDKNRSIQKLALLARDSPTQQARIGDLTLQVTESYGDLAAWVTSSHQPCSRTTAIPRGPSTQILRPG